ncbi:MAG: aryl-sulfate sulfotransferase [Saprospiraceae bacterium]
MTKFYCLFAFLFLVQISSTGQTVGLFLNDSISLNGYTLFSHGNSKITYLIDNCGNEVHRWDQSTTNPGASVYLLENGNLLRTGRINSNFNGGGTGGRLEIFNWEGDLIWQYDYSSNTYHHHHDVAPMANGNILLIAWETRVEVELETAGRNPASISNPVWSERVVEIKPIGTDEIEIVWQWQLWDHLIQDFDSTKMNYGVVAEHPELMDVNFGVTGGNNTDWIHLNSIDYNPDLDQIILSSRHLSEIYVIDHSTTTVEAAGHSGGISGKGGDFLFRYGNPQSYDRGTSDDRAFYGQHDAKWIPTGYPDEGKIMVFNNGQGRPGGSYSSVDVIDPPMDFNNTYTISDTEPFGPEDLFWTYEADPPEDMYSSNISGAHRLSNGNTLICVGREGNFYEVNYDGELVWHYRLPIGNAGPVSQGTIVTNSNVFRATRYGTDYPAFIDKDLTPGDPIEVNPLPSDCEIYDASVATKDYANLEGVQVVNNPFYNFIFIKNQTENEVNIEVFDLMGRLQKSQFSTNENIEISTSHWQNGFYTIRISNREKNRFFVQKLIKQ